LHLQARAEPADFGAFVPGETCRRGPTRHGALDGLAFAVKDLIDVAGCRTGGGNPTWLAQQAPAARSAPVVDRALAAGATLIGKTVTDELAFSLEGRNVHYAGLTNPVCPDRLPGGSSSGSAVAVAAGLADFAFGTDTGGSVRVPANFLGLFGFRPTHGAIPHDGVVRFAPSYDTVGWFARDAALLARIGEVLLPPEASAPITKLLLAGDAFALLDAPLARELRSKAARLGATGSATVFADQGPLCLDCYRVLQDAEVWQSLGAWITASRPDFAPDIAPRFAGAATVTAAQAERYRPVRAALRARIAALVPPDTALVMPVACSVAPEKTAPPDVIGDFYRRTLTLTSIAGHCGVPQVVFPLGLWDGCPIGLSAIGARGSDAALLRLALDLAPAAVQDSSS